MTMPMASVKSVLIEYFSGRFQVLATRDSLNFRYHRLNGPKQGTPEYNLYALRSLTTGQIHGPEHLQGLACKGGVHDGFDQEIRQKKIECQQRNSKEKQRPGHACRAAVGGAFLALSGTLLLSPEPDLKEYDDEHRGG